MRKYLREAILGAVLGLLASAELATPSLAETGQVVLVFKKGGLIVGVGAGKGVLTFRGKNYPFSVSGMSVGFTIGASSSRFSGRALNLKNPGDLAGGYTTGGAGGALGAGVGGVQLQNSNGVVLLLVGPRVGVEASVAAGGVAITMQ
jgi:hypothetical protein